MKKANKIAIGVFALALIVAAFCLMSNTVYALTLNLMLDPNFNLGFSPSITVQSISHYQLLQTQSVQTVRTYDFLGVQSIYLTVNVTAYNTNGTQFLKGGVVIDTLAQQKITFYKEYNAVDYTPTVNVFVDAYLRVDRNGTSIEKSYHGNWTVTVPSESQG